jgi:hypothetical protein
MASCADASGSIVGAATIASVSACSSYIDADLGTYTHVSNAGIDANSAIRTATFAALSTFAARAARAVAANTGPAHAFAI